MRLIFGLLTFLCSTMNLSAQPITEQLSLGNDLTSVNVYVFTDWLCPVCKMIEPRIEEMSPKIMQEAKLHFIDIPLHDTSHLFVRYNVSFLVNNKNEYLKTRHVLDKLTDITKNPKDDQLLDLLKEQNITFKPLDSKQIEEATAYFIRMAKEMKVKATPTIVVFNSQTKKTQVLRGPSEITEENVLKAIESVKKNP